MVPWPSGFSDEVITTPLPLASERYADVSLSAGNQASLLTLRLRARPSFIPM